jgi:hypothetical protein
MLANLTEAGTRSLAFNSTTPMLLRSESQTLDFSPVRSESWRRGLNWTTAESKICKLHRAALGELTEEESRRLYSLELSASQHAGKSPRRLLERANRITGNA